MPHEEYLELGQPAVTSQHAGTDNGGVRRGEPTAASRHRPCARGVIERFYHYIRQDFAPEVEPRVNCALFDELNARVEAWPGQQQLTTDNSDTQRLAKKGGKSS